MATNSSTRSDSPAEVDFSVIRTSIDMGHKTIDQILNGVHYGSDEVRHLLREECDFVFECKVCKNLFRSFPNFVAHKRVYCTEYYEDKLSTEKVSTDFESEDTVVVEPTSVETVQQQSRSSADNGEPVVERVIKNTFDGKSKDYQFYTKVAEEVEKRKAGKVSNTITLTSIPTNSNAVIVSHKKGDGSEASVSPKRQSPGKNGTDQAYESVHSKERSVGNICAELARRQLLQEPAVSALPASGTVAVRVSARQRKSSPRKSSDYLDFTRKVGQGKATSSIKSTQGYEPMECSDSASSENINVNDNVIDKRWLKFCDVKNSFCKICKRTFSSLYNLKLHAKMKHVNVIPLYDCPCCEKTFEHFKSLARHLRNNHHKTDAFINNVKMKVGHKAIVGTESESDTSSVTSSPKKSSSPERIPGNLVSVATGWKKCDKCGKVCWKAKSFYRHYTSCKGSGSHSSPASSTSSSPGKLEKATNSNVNARNTTALLRLEEKLRASVTQGNNESSLKQTQNEKQQNISRPRSTSKERNAVEKRTENKVSPVSVLLKALTSPLQKVKPTGLDKQPEVLEETVKAKPYTFRDVNKQVFDNKEKNSKDHGASTETREGTDVTDAAGFKELKEKLAREAGIQEKKEEPKQRPYGTRQAFHPKEAEETVRKSIEKDEHTCGTIDNRNTGLTKLKDLRVRESPEMKQLEMKLTREAFGDKTSSQKDREELELLYTGPRHRVSENKGENTCSRNYEEDKMSKVQKKKLTSTESLGENMFENIAKCTVDTEKKTRSTSKESRSRRESVSESIRLKMEAQEKSEASKKDFHKSVSIESRRRRTVSEKTPEKMQMLIDHSTPILSPVRTSSLPVSPTPSNQSASGDGYNLKFKMTVQEMAELVESASLTKFAKERKKRARKILNKKQVRESQKVPPGFSKPGKKKAKKGNMGSLLSLRTRSRSAETEIQSSRTVDKSSKLSREQKRLQNSEGFMEENYYAVTPGRELHKERESEHESERKRHSRDRNYESDASMDSSKRAWSRERRKAENVSERGYDSDMSIDSCVSKSSKTKERPHLENRSRMDKHTARELKRLQASTGFVDKTADMAPLEVTDTKKLPPVTPPDKQGKKTDRHSSKESTVHMSSEENLGHLSAELKDTEEKDVSTSQYNDIVRAPNLVSQNDSVHAKEKHVSREIKRLAASAGFVDKTSNVEISAVQSGQVISGEVESDKGVTVTRHGEHKQGKSLHSKEKQLAEVDSEHISKAAKGKPENTAELEKTMAESEKRLPIIQQRKEPEEKLLNASTGEKHVTDMLSSNTESIGTALQVKTKDAPGNSRENPIDLDAIAMKKRYLSGAEKISDLSSENERMSLYTETEKLMNIEKEIAIGLSKAKAGLQSEVNKEQPKKDKPIVLTVNRDIGAYLKSFCKMPVKENYEAGKKDNSGSKDLEAIVKPISGQAADSSKQLHVERRNSIGTSIYGITVGLTKGQTQGNGKKANNSPNAEDEINVVNEKESGEGGSKPLILSDTSMDELERKKDEKNKMPSSEHMKDNHSGKKGHDTANETKETSMRQHQLEGSQEDRSDRMRARSESPKHRTRLSTGSIYFDPDLKKLSPKKADKNLSEKSKGQLETSKSDTDAEPTDVSAVKKRLSLSSNKTYQDIKNKHSRTQSAPQRYSLSTGVKQCPKCNRKFWKKKAYEFHLKNSVCGDRKKGKISKKRALSVEENLETSVSENLSKKSRTDQNEADKLSECVMLDEQKDLQLSTTVLSVGTSSKVGADVVKESNIHADLCVNVDNLRQESIVPVHAVVDRVEGVKQEDEEMPGSSTSDQLQSPDGESDADDDGSDFSGFTEEDLKTSELELSQVETGTRTEISKGGSGETMVSGNEPGTKPDIKSAGKRPVRKSAQNPFGHVEEIWVYKEPGKPAIEKTKFVKNREYVVDATNPSKLQCHNIKDVDKLIDEEKLKCKQCDTPCTSISNLRRHVIRHLGWKRYKCKHCNYTCYDMSNCRQHVLRAHNDKLTNKNFNKYITDLKKEATKKRAAKRTITLHKSKQNEDRNVYNRPKRSMITATAMTNVGEQNLHPNRKPLFKKHASMDVKKHTTVKCDPQHIYMSSENTVGSKTSTPDLKKVNVADFFVKPGKAGTADTGHSASLASPSSKGVTPLLQARLSLAKALGD